MMREQNSSSNIAWVQTEYTSANTVKKSPRNCEIPVLLQDGSVNFVRPGKSGVASIKSR